MIVEVARIHPEARLPEYKSPGAACFDLETIETVTLPPGEVTDVRTGLVFRIPQGHVLIVQPRSSSPRHGYAMPHSIGIIDSDYCGPKDELYLRLKNVTNRPVVLEKHQRVVQAYVIPIPTVEFKEIPKSKLGKKSRGGFGSTGHK